MHEFTQNGAVSPHSTCSGFQVLSLKDASLKPREYKKRRMHKKTRYGCLTCKIKRVKCDEGRPICVRCQRNGRPCNYTRETAMHSRCQFIDLSLPPGTVQRVSKLNAVTVVPFPCSSAGHSGTPSIHLMQHFERHWSKIFGIPQNNDIIPLFQSNSLVRNTILAFTASHLRHVSPFVREHRITEYHQQSLALKDYQMYLNTPRHILGQPGANAMLLSAALLNMLAFVLPPSTNRGEHGDPSTSWVFNPDESGLCWLAMQAGIRPLMLSMAGYLSNATEFLGLMFVRDNQWTMSMSVSNYNTDIIPKAWVKAFKLDIEDSAPVNYSFWALLLILAHLRLADPSQVNLFRNLQFLGKIYVDLSSLLYERDERVLWMLGYWLGLMSRGEGMWWYEQRIKRDYEAIYIWLDSLDLPQRLDVNKEAWREMMKEYQLAPVWPRLCVSC